MTTAIAILDPLGHVARWHTVLTSGRTFLLCDRCEEWFVARRLVVVAQSL